MLIVHHLQLSQSDRIIWVCEELGLPYELKLYQRDPATRAAPPAYKALHHMGTAPVIQDDGVTLPESSAIVEYICRKLGGGRLMVEPGAANYAQFLHWYHFANGSFMPSTVLAFFGGGADKAVSERDRLRFQRIDRVFEMVEQRLGEAAYFAGADFTAADIMMSFPLTTMRMFVPRDISGCPNLLGYLQRIGARPAYQRAVQKGDPGLTPKLT